MSKLIYLPILFLLASCALKDRPPATEEQQKQAMDQAVFDESVITNLSRYDDLKNFLSTYGDTIIAYRNERNYGIRYSDTGKADSFQVTEDCYRYFEKNDRHDITNVPDFLKPKLDSIYNKIGSTYIKAFEICKDKKIRIEVRSESRGNGLYISHNLLWNAKLENDYHYLDNKDTLMMGGCIYRIGLREQERR